MIDDLLTDAWRATLSHHDQLMVGFSGGLDSTVLLHVLANERAFIGQLRAVHVHHGLSLNADAWLRHCQQVCETLSIPLMTQKVQCDARSNIEEGARTARYQVFSNLMNDNDGLLLAHHADDQAETLLLQLFRGAGIDGMAAMTAFKPLKKGMLIRPFLEHSREMLEKYAQYHQLSWIEDESNQNRMFSRNYLRHQILPLLQDKWPNIVGNLARSARHCQQAKINLDNLAEIDVSGLKKEPGKLSLASISGLSLTRLANVLRVWLRYNNVRRPPLSVLNRLINEVILARGDATPIVGWDGVRVQRFQHDLYLLKNKIIKPQLVSLEWSEFPTPLVLKGVGILSAAEASSGLLVRPNCRITVGYRQGGELFYWHGQTKQLKKLWQEWKVPPWERDSIPLLYIDGALAAVVGFAVNDQFYSHGAKNTYSVHIDVYDDDELETNNG